jgi:uncharacterized protein with HEPN domain
MSNRDRVALLHMLDHAREAVELIRGKSRSDLDTHRMLNLSLVRLVEVIGEAASRVSAETKQKNPRIPWPEIISMRNRLIHGYDTVDFDILWRIVHDDLPPLISQLERLVSSGEK